MSQERDPRGFRALLFLLAILLGLLALGGLTAAGVIHAALGLRGLDDAPAFVATARLLGASTLPAAVAAFLAALRPERNRALLVLLFVELVALPVTLVVAAAKGEVGGLNAAVFVTIALVLLLFLFRFYPRVISDVTRPDQEPDEPKT